MSTLAKKTSIRHNDNILFLTCCFSIIRIGLIKGAERMEAAVAAAKPGFSPSPRKKEKPSLSTARKKTEARRDESKVSVSTVSNEMYTQDS